MFDRLQRGYRLLTGFALMSPRSRRTLAYQFQRHARSSHGERPFLLYGDRSYSYREANAIVNRYAHALKTLGVGRGDVVALVLDNRPEFLWHFLAAGKLGAIASLVNSHNVGAPLLHSLRICEPKLIVVGSEHAPSFDQIRAELGEGVRVVVEPDPLQLDSSLPELPRFSQWLTAASDADPEEAGHQKLGDLAAYIYTSGTTGLPKVAVIRQQRLYIMALGFGTLAWRIRPSDVIYNCLPLYHANGIGVATAAVIMRGATMALARRFSGSRFWDDVRRHQATGFVYIGELCRYLMSQPERPLDRDHRVERIVGNGLRSDIWQAFQQRFGIPHVREFYGSTEGNVAAVNLDDQVGSVGRLVVGGVLAKWDEDKDDFVRGPNGFLVKCKPGEPGVLLGRIRRISFDGYRDGKETERKIVRNAWRRGDAWFNTGDLLRADEERRLYFVDRMGDTFRWKGENVSTFEVQEQLAGWSLAAEVNVYGVQVPGTEGRAGMAALVLRGELDLQAFKQHVDATLPAYARPLFVRVLDKLETTSTFKLKKTELRDEGYDPRALSDALYLRHPQNDAYVPLTVDLFEAVQAGKLRL